MYVGNGRERLGLSDAYIEASLVQKNWRIYLESAKNNAVFFT